MKKKIFGGLAIVAIAVAMAFNISLSNQKQDRASLLALANIEVLADAEEFQILCSQRPISPGYCWFIEFTHSGMDYWCRATGNPKDRCWY